MRIVSVGRVWLMAIVGIAVANGGCKSSSVSTSREWGWELPKPDKLIVHDFAVTPADAKLDRNMETTGTALRDAQDRNVGADEARLGRLVSDKLSKALVDELNQAGITAVRDGPN